MTKAPGRADREGMTVMELMQRFPDEEAARQWFESVIWPHGRHCPHCGSTDTFENPASESRPYRCKSCHRHFSVRIGTLMERSRISLQKWAIAIYLHMTSLKGVSSMKLHRDIGVTQKTAWFMLQRIRKAFDNDDEPPFAGPVETDETFIGGNRKNMSNAKRKALAEDGAGRGTVGKAVVVGAKDRASNKVRARVVEGTDKETLQGFVRETVEAGAALYTDEHGGYTGLKGEFAHEAVNHGVKEFVRGKAHTQGIESFWSLLKRAYVGVYHKMSAKHLDRYVADFAGRHGVRGLDTVGQMAHIAAHMVGKRLTYAALIADNGLASGARS